MERIDSYIAVKKGLILIISTSMIFMIIGLGIGIYFINIFNLHIIFVFVCVLISMIIYWPVWSYLLVKWKIWAFTRIDDIDLLLKMSQKRALIYPDNHFYSKNEFCSSNDKEKIKKLIKKRKDEDTYKILYDKYSKKEIVIFTKMGRFLRNDPLLKLSINTIYIDCIGEIDWKEFSRIDFHLEFGKPSDCWMDFILNDNRYKFDLNRSETPFTKLEYLFKTYKKLATIHRTISGQQDQATRSL